MVITVEIDCEKGIESFRYIGPNFLKWTIPTKNIYDVLLLGIQARPVRTVLLSISSLSFSMHS